MGTMSEPIAVIIVGVLSLIGTLTGSFFNGRKNTALITYRIDLLEKKVNEHNNLISRTYAVEEEAKILQEQMKVVNHRIKDLEEKG